MFNLLSLETQLLILSYVTKFPRRFLEEIYIGPSYIWYHSETNKIVVNYCLKKVHCIHTKIPYIKFMQLTKIPFIDDTILYIGYVIDHKKIIMKPQRKQLMYEYTTNYNYNYDKSPQLRKRKTRKKQYVKKKRINKKIKKSKRISKQMQHLYHWQNDESGYNITYVRSLNEYSKFSKIDSYTVYNKHYDYIDENKFNYLYVTIKK